MVLYTEYNTKTLFLHTVSKKPVVAYLLKAFRKDMMQKTADKFFMGEGYNFFLVCAVVLGPKRNHVIINRYDS